MRIQVLGVAICLGTSSAAHAVAIPVTYLSNPAQSWVAAGVNTPIATSPTATIGSAQDIKSNRHNAQTFTTGATGFTLDKIWIHYQNLQSPSAGFGPGTAMELKLFTVANPTAAAFLPGANLFAVPQEHVVPTVDNAIEGHFVVFDVEDVALAANTSYGFQFVTNGFPYQWSRASAFAGGAAYSVVNVAPTFDHLFALQAAPAQQPPGDTVPMPEPATASLAMGALAMLLRRRRSV